MPQSNPRVAIREPGNALEFGFAALAGYANTFGAMVGSGFSVLAINAEADASDNTFTTRGRLGTVIRNELAGALIFSRVTSTSAIGQTLAESARFEAAGNFKPTFPPVLPSKVPSSATAAGITGKFAWDPDYFYQCVATNTWKRSPLPTWRPATKFSEGLKLKRR